MRSIFCSTNSSLAAWLMLCAAGFAQDVPAIAKRDTLQTILDRIHNHAAAEAWPEKGWQDEQAEDWLEKVTEKIIKAANVPEWKLPVQIAVMETRGLASGSPAPSRLENTLLVGKAFNLRNTRLRNCVIFADGNVLVDGLERCVVVARGAVSARNAASSAIVSGAYVRLTTDGDPRNVDNGSLVVSRGWANIQNIHGSIILAPEGVTIGRTVDGGIFINSTLVLAESVSLISQRKPRSVKVRDLPIDDLPEHPLSKQIDVKGVIYPQAIEAHDRLQAGLNFNVSDAPRPRPTGVVMQFEGRRYVVNLSKPILDQSEQPVNILAGWRLTYLCNELAIFSSSDADAVLRIEAN